MVIILLIIFLVSSTKILNSIHSYRKLGKMNRVENKIGCYYPRITKNDLTVKLEDDDINKLLKLNKIQEKSGFYIKYKEYEFKIRNLRDKRGIHCLFRS